MTSILERNKNLKKPVKKRREEYAEDALYREVWEDVNNEKTQQFIKKYWRYIVGAVLGIMILISAFQLGMRMYHSSRIASAQVYETAIANMDANALANISKDSSGATSDLALFQSYLIDKDVKKLEDLAKNAHTRDFKDLAKLHLASINGDSMKADEFEKYLSGMNTKKSPFFYTSRLMVAEKYLSVNNKDKADKILNMIINDKDAPASVSETAQTLR
ncbi:MAG: hypothetical protein IKN73_02660 [Alphaproteobacteria bacterium]|nr:hypothetical protein [Alphaproteobacteria bacterium]